MPRFIEITIDPSRLVKIEFDRGLGRIVLSVDDSRRGTGREQASIRMGETAKKGGRQEEIQWGGSKGLMCRSHSLVLSK